MQAHMRIARIEDAPRLLQIYTPYVRTTSITSEYGVPSLDEFRSRIAHTLERYPYFVCEMPIDEIVARNPHADIPQGSDGMGIVGYIYAGPLKTRTAYQWSAEVSIYVDASLRRMGIGKLMENTLIHALLMQNVTNLYAYVTYPIDNANPYADTNSYDFHTHFGYAEVAHLHYAQRKFGYWTDLVVMEKFIADHDPSIDPFIPFSQTRDRVQKMLDESN